MLPAETILAAFPPALTVEGVRLNPPTPYHAIALESLGVKFGGEVNPGNVYIAAFVLSQNPEELHPLMEDGSGVTERFKAWMRGAKKASISALAKAVSSQMKSALALHVPIASKDKKKSFMPTGYGWPLELGESLAHEYSLPFDKAMSMPIATAFGLMACCAKRNGAKAGAPDYYDRIFTNAVSAAKGKDSRKEKPGNG